MHATKLKSSWKTPAAVSSRRVRRPTIYDLARVVDVSPGTVSRVLNNRDRVSVETRDRVLRAVRELNLKPHAPARIERYSVA